MTKERRLEALRRQIGRVERRLLYLEGISSRFSWLRLVVFLAGSLAAVLVFFLAGARYFWAPLVVTALVFAIVVRYHRQVERSLARHRIWLAIKQSHVARMQLDWERLRPATGQPEHPLELDLDLVGDYSLVRLIDTAVSDGGSQQLRKWLRDPIQDPAQIVERQQIVCELASRPLFRDKLILNGTLADKPGERWHSDRLLSWLKGHALPPSVHRWLLILAFLAAANAILFLLDIAGLAPPLWLGTLLLYFTLFLINSRKLGEPFREAAHLRDALEQLLAVFQQLETFNYRQTPHLKALNAPFLDRQQRPSRHLGRVNRVLSATGIRGNPLLWLILNVVAPWDFYFAHRLNVLKQDLSKLLPSWLATWFRLEALSALANLAYLNPAYSFPEIASGNDGAVFSASGLGHPLIADTGRVCNDFAIERLGFISLFTGSNMSGKSTFLRTVGINLVLAFAGGPVNAVALRAIPFRLHTCIRISDSVTDGISYFYAEVKCLKKLLAELDRDDAYPLIYFIDEIFRGTNNRERLIGSRAYIQALAGKGGVGLIATHDLELVHLADEIEAVKNYHFTDKVTNGRLFFDYELHRGPSPTTNALTIMRMEGLPVETTGS